MKHEITIDPIRNRPHWFHVRSKYPWPLDKHVQWFHRARDQAYMHKQLILHDAPDCTVVVSRNINECVEHDRYDDEPFMTYLTPKFDSAGWDPNACKWVREDD